MFFPYSVYLCESGITMVFNYLDLTSALDCAEREAKENGNYDIWLQANRTGLIKDVVLHKAYIEPCNRYWREPAAMIGAEMGDDD